MIDIYCGLLVLGNVCIYYVFFSFMYQFVIISFILFFLTWVRKIQGRLNVPSVSQFYDPVNMAHLEAVDTCLRNDEAFGFWGRKCGSS